MVLTSSGIVETCDEDLRLLIGDYSLQAQHSQGVGRASLHTQQNILCESGFLLLDVFNSSSQSCRYKADYEKHNYAVLGHCTSFRVLKNKELVSMGRIVSSVIALTLGWYDF